MLLALDVGNTNVHFGVFQGPELLTHGDISNSRERTADELGLLLTQLLLSRGIYASAVRAAAIASVVPMVTGTVLAAVTAAFDVEAFVLGAGADLGVGVRYDDPREVGADRLANAVGGFARYGGPLIVVDFGTATTFDVVSRKGEYIGGVICPGIGISADALFQRAARLPRVDVRNPGRVIGRSTVGSIQSGLFFGYASMVEGIIGRIRAELKEPARVVATGGLAETLARAVPSIEAVDGALTLTGLRLIWERNQAVK